MLGLERIIVATSSGRNQHSCTGLSATSRPIFARQACASGRTSWKSSMLKFCRSSGENSTSVPMVDASLNTSSYSQCRNRSTSRYNALASVGVNMKLIETCTGYR